jgi:hypothetical protein
LLLRLLLLRLLLLRLLLWQGLLLRSLLRLLLGSHVIHALLPDGRLLGGAAGKGR